MAWVQVCCHANITAYPHTPVRKCLCTGARCSLLSRPFAACSNNIKALLTLAQCGRKRCHLILSGVNLATLLSPPDNFTKACWSLSNSKSSKLLSCLARALIKVICLGALLRSGDRTSCNTCIAPSVAFQRRLELPYMMEAGHLLMMGMHWSGIAFLKLHQG